VARQRRGVASSGSLAATTEDTGGAKGRGVGKASGADTTTKVGKVGGALRGATGCDRLPLARLSSVLTARVTCTRATARNGLASGLSLLSVLTSRLLVNLSDGGGNNLLLRLPPVLAEIDDVLEALSAH
jgi:hypothetical protein